MWWWWWGGGGRYLFNRHLVREAQLWIVVLCIFSAVGGLDGLDDKRRMYVCVGSRIQYICHWYVRVRMCTHYTILPPAAAAAAAVVAAAAAAAAVAAAAAAAASLR